MIESKFNAIACQWLWASVLQNCDDEVFYLYRDRTTTSAVALR
jgi:hypothetical protein